MFDNADDCAEPFVIAPPSMQIAEMTKRAGDGFFLFKRGYDFIRGKMTGLKSLPESLERLTIEAPVIQDSGCTHQDLAGAVQNGFHLYSMARNTPQVGKFASGQRPGP